MSFESTTKKSKETVEILQDAAMVIGVRQEKSVLLKTINQSLVPGLDLEEDARVLRAKAQDITKGIFKLIVVGEFNCGKSTLLNALIEENALVMNILPATAVITMLVHSPHENEPLRVRTYGHNGKILGTYNRTEFQDKFRWAMEDATKALKGEFDGRLSEIAFAEVDSRHPLCANKVRVIDSPGLAHHETMTKLTTYFFKQADAIIFMLDAGHLFTEREQLFLSANFKKQYHNNLFFVVNKMDSVDERARRDVENYVRLHLEPYFHDATDKFDAHLYTGHVFFVSARAGLQAVTQKTPDQVAYAASGVKDLRDHLMAFLQSEGKNRSIFSATLANFRYVCCSAHDYSKRQRAFYTKQVDVLKSGKIRVDSYLSEVRRDAKHTEHIVDDVGDNAKRAYYTAFRNFMVALGEGFGDGVDFTVSATNMQDKTQLEATLHNKLSEYFKIQLAAWNANEGSDVIQNEIDDLKGQLQDSLARFQFQLRHVNMVLEEAQITQKIDQIQIPAEVYEEASELVQEIAVQPNFSVSLEGNNYNDIFVATLVREFADQLPNWLGDIIRNLIDWIFAPQEKIKSELRKALTQFLHTEMDSVERRQEIYALIEKEFTIKTKRRLNRVLDQQISRIEKQINEAIRKLQNTDFDPEQEMQRLEQIEEALQALQVKLQFVVEN